jgi:hypothetical protein
VAVSYVYLAKPKGKKKKARKVITFFVRFDVESFELLRDSRLSVDSSPSG